MPGSELVPAGSRVLPALYPQRRRLNSPARWQRFVAILAFALFLLVTAVGAQQEAAASNWMPRHHQAQLRVLNWNVSRQHFFADSERSAALLAAAGADILLLDEMPIDATPEALRDALENALPGAPWSVVLGDPGGSRERASISSRWPLQRVTRFDTLRFSRRDQRAWLAAAGEQAEKLREQLPMGVAAAGAIADIDGRRILLVSFDLQCCGASPETFEESKRRAEARLIRGAIEVTLAESRIDAVITGGDANNVHGDEVLRILQGGQPELVGVNAVREDGSDWTWDGRGTPFLSKKIDHVLHDSGLVTLQARVLDTEGWSGTTLSHHRLQRDWSALSRHRPIVVDLGPIDRSSGGLLTD